MDNDTTAPNVDEIWKKKGNFVNCTTGEVIEQPGGDFPIAAGPWPNPNIGCRQVRCSSCKGFAGLGPKGWELHQANSKGRPIFCPRCFELLLLMERQVELMNPFARF